ncbi:hypothetical protein CALVIDRAFT_561772 [Calocera viscosa TUFC12733]|uniref:Uncharacterized protein n=1 Tax=Calocera viscosa (strain TUFC12733) TaxID=1330018 RepID=A0A167PIK4_CALVF|nr:hypothetical protein CALVIDRAFT_561772 [Calocera viscosa TUFC12733]
MPVPETPQPPQRPLLPSFPSTESMRSVSSCAEEEEHYAYPQVLAHLTATFLPNDHVTTPARKTPPRSRRFKTTPDLRREHLALLTSKLHPVAPKLHVRSATPTKRQPASRRQLEYQDMNELQGLLRRSPSLHATVVDVSNEDIVYTEEPHRFTDLEQARSPPLREEPILVPMPTQESIHPTYHRAHEEREFDGWLKPPASPSTSMHQPAPLARARAVRRQARKPTPTTLHWADDARPFDAPPAGMPRRLPSFLRRSSSWSTGSPDVAARASPPPRTRFGAGLLSQSLSCSPSSSVRSLRARSLSPMSWMGRSSSPLPRPRSRLGNVLGNVMHSFTLPRKHA